MKVVYGILVDEAIIKNLKEKPKYAYETNETSYICGLEVCEFPLRFFSLNFKEYDEFYNNKENQDKLNEIMGTVLKIWVDFIQEKTLELKQQNKSVKEVEKIMSEYDLPENIEIEFFVIGD